MRKWLIVSETGERIGLWADSACVCVGGKDRLQGEMDRAMGFVSDTGKWSRVQVQRNKRRWTCVFDGDDAAEQAAANAAKQIGLLPGVLVREVRSLGRVVI